MSRRAALEIAAAAFACTLIVACDDSRTRTVTVIASVAAPEEEWVDQFGTTGGANDIANAVAADSSGNVFVVGQTVGALPGQTNASLLNDAFLRKLDANGAEVWTRQFGTTGTDRATSVTVAATGEIYVAGIVGGVLSSNPADLYVGGDDVFLRKFDANGTALWTRQLGSLGSDAGNGVAVDESGVYLVGQTTLVIIPGETNAGSNDAFIRKYSLDGTTVLWEDQFGTAAGDLGIAVLADAGFVYISGNTSGGLDGEAYSNAGIEGYVRKHDATTGARQWTKLIGSQPTRNEQALALATDGTSIYVSGLTTGTVTATVNAGNQDAYVRAYATDGNIVWTRQWGSTGTDIALGVAADATGVYAAGRNEGPLPGQTFVGVGDVFVKKFEADGDELWTTTFGSPFFDGANKIAAGGGVVAVAGQVEGALPGQTAAGNADAFVRRVNAGTGAEVWTRQFGTLGPVDDIAFAVGSDASGNTYVAGLTRGTLPGQTNDGLADPFVRKYDPFGSPIWTRQEGTEAFDIASGLAVAPTGVAICGRSDVALPGQTFVGGASDAYVRMYDTDGNEEWTRQFGTVGFDNANGVAVDATGVYVAGSVGATLVASILGAGDGFVRKYSLDGQTVLWTQQLSGTGNDNPAAVATDGSFVYVAGTTQGGGDFASAVTGSAGGDFDAFLSKRSAATGAPEWTFRLGTTVGDNGLAVAVSSGAIYLGGITGATLTGQVRQGGTSDGFVARFDPNGNLVWLRQFGSAGGDQVLGLTTDATGVIAVGFAGQALPGQVSVAGSADAFVQKFDFNGNVVYIRQFGSIDFDIARAVSAGPDGAIRVAGEAPGAIDGQPYAGALDAFVVKFLPGRFP